MEIINGILVAGFILLLLLGMRISVAMLLIGTTGIIVNRGVEPALGYLATTPLNQVASFTLITIPLFVLLAEVAAQSGIAGSLFDTMKLATRKAKTGLPMATILSSAVLGTLSGSSIAVTAVMSRIAVPEMTRAGYSRPLALGSSAAGGVLAVMIPPSIPLVLYGIITETSIGQLLLAGIIPGIIGTILFIVAIAIWGKVKPGIFPERKVQMQGGSNWSVILRSWPFIVILAIIFVLLYTGVVTAIEAAAVGAALTLLLSLVVFRMRWSALDDSLISTVKTTVMIMTLLIGAYVFGYFLVVSGITPALISGLVGLPVDRHVLLILIVLLYFLLGMFLSQLELMVLTLPLLFPVVTQLGFDPVWFGIIVVATAEVGLLTPPVGMNVFAAAGALKDVKVEEVFRGVWPFVAANIVLIALLIAVPQLATIIPETMIGR